MGSSYYEGGALTGLSASRTPAGSGFKEWTFDPALAVSTQTLTSGRIEYRKITLTRGETLTGACLNVTTGGGTLTSAQNLMALFDTAGTRLALSGDMTTPWAGTGFIDAAFTAPYAAAAGNYFIAVLCVGGTPITISRGQNTTTSANGRLANISPAVALADQQSIRSTGTANTSIPSSVDFTTAVQVTGTPMWMGVY